jgi:hypothetical protein
MTMTKKEQLAKAQEMDKKFRNLRQAFRRHWAIYGEMAIQFEKLEYFKLLGFPSMKQYLKSLEDACYSTIAEAMKVIKSLPEIPSEELNQYPKENLKILANLPESKRTKASILAKCKTMKASDFRAYANDKHNANLEGKVRYIIDCTPSQVVVYDGFVAHMQEIAEANNEKLTKSECFEYVAATMLQEHATQKPSEIKMSLKPKRNIKVGV